MNENFTNTELLIRYLDDELEGEQLEAVKKSIAENSAAREELENLRLAKEAIKSYGLKNKIGAIHTEMMRELNKNVASKKGMVKNIFQYSMRIAAAVILITGLSVSYQYFTASPGKLFDENFEAFNLHETRGAAVSPLENIYKNGNMQAVIQQFSTLTDPQPPDYFLAGNAFLSTQQPGKAIQAFLTLQLRNKTNNTHYFEEDTEYYLALSYLINKELPRAVPLFEKIHADKNHPYHKKISSWFLNKLHRLIPAGE
ncbi:MAG: hypothetical protein ABI707_03745 [Ferruginibacter sp.]